MLQLSTPRRRWLRAGPAVGTLVLLASVAVSPPAHAGGWQAVDTVDGSGLAASAETWGAATVDHDGDGDEDVWVGYHDHGGKLWANDGTGTYRWVARHAWPALDTLGTNAVDRHSCTWADVDGDGRPDAYCTVGRGAGNVVKDGRTGRDNELWLQRSPGRFTDVGTSWGVGDPCGRGYHATFLDADGDVHPDLFVGNDTPRESGPDPCDDPASGLPDEQSKLYVDTGGTGLRHARGLGVAGNGGRGCAEVADLDRDGWQDLLVCGPARVELHRNDAGRGFTDIGASLGLRGAYGDADLADLDGDGHPDLVHSFFGQLSYRRGSGTAFGPDVRIDDLPLGVDCRALALGDADGDGDLDVYGVLTSPAGATEPADRIYLNDGLRFHGVPVPRADGAGADVATLDGDGDGRSEFLVLNGQDVPGAVQRIELVPR